MLQSKPLRILLLLNVILALYIPAAARAGASPWMPMVVENGQMYIESSIEGIDGYSLVDTGANINLVNDDFLSEQGLKYKKGRKVVVSGVFGQERRDTYRSVPVSLFGNEVNFRGLVTASLGGGNVQFILGASFFERYVFQLDYPNERARVFDRSSVDLKKSKNILSRSAPSGEPMVKVTLNNDREVWLLLDTGNALGFLLDRSIVVQEDWHNTQAIETINGFGATSSGDIERFNISSLQIGPFNLENPIVATSPQGQTLKVFEKSAEIGSRVKKLNSPYDGILGHDVLKHFVVTIDYKRGLVHLSPGAVETG